MNKRSLKAFTLTELLVALSIFTVIMGAVYTTFLVGNRSWVVFNTNAMLQREAREAMMVMTKELRKAKDVLVIRDKESIRMNFVRPSIGPVSYLWTSTGPEAYKLIRKNQSHTKILAHNVTHLSFEYLKDSILIDITAGMNRPSGDNLSFRLKEKVALRL